MIHDDIRLDSIILITSTLGETHGWMHLFVPCSRGSQWWVSEEEVISRWNHLRVFNVASGDRALKSTKIQVFFYPRISWLQVTQSAGSSSQVVSLVLRFLSLQENVHDQNSVLKKAYETAKNDLSVFINGICILKIKLCLLSKYGCWQKILLSKR